MSRDSGETANDNTATVWSETKPGEEVVISGIAGRFPESDNMTIFRENLFNKVNLVTHDDRRWRLDHPEIPQRTGKINNVGKFDSEFFGINFVQAHTLDPMCRMILEHAYEAIVDAGVNPRQFRGSNTGVFIGSCFSESEKTWFYEKLKVSGAGITGCSRAMLANRISHWLGCNGPSYTVDSACSSSLFALDHAYKAIRSGQCDAALVGGSNLCLHPYVSLQFSRLGVLSSDGRCKSFDAEANGYVRSETVAMIFLQKSKDAKRIYSRIIHTKTNCDGYKEQGITFPSSKMQEALMKQFYEECRIPPSLLSYVEAHGTGTTVGDPEELNALEKIFCPGRTTPLRVGAVKSNLGHSEAASGLCSIAKVIIGMESGYIPPNLHYTRPREGVKALADGRIKVITEPTPWEGGYVGINSFGFGGANCHILLESNPKEKVDGGKPKDDLPRLVVVSGRTVEAVTTLLDHLESKPADVEYISLFYGIHAEEIPGHLYRGYTILPTEGIAGNGIRDVQHYPGAKRPVWFIFSGIGSQWAGMGEALLKIPVFARAIEMCDAALKPRGVDIIDILTNKDPKTFDNILNSFVGITTIQIGLVDVLKSIGIVPNNIIGDSVGELGCAYADGCLTAEQVVLAAYYRGMALMETKSISGSMAAVGLGFNKIKDLCPPDIEVACHNGPEISTISGPADSITEFVTKLQADNNIFAEEVPCSNIAHHSRYIATAGRKLLAYLEKVIPNPKPRSEKWLSTSVPRNKWNTSAARLCSAEYHTNNLLSPVLFEETSRLIPKNAITIELAPHGLLQAILRSSLDDNVTNIALTKRGHKDNVEVLLQAIGKMYEVGLHPQLSNLYPEVKYPVSRGTPLISPLIRWKHSEDWYVTSYRMQEKLLSGVRIVQVTLSDEDFEWMAGHIIDERNLIPATGYLTLIWETLGMTRGELYTEVAVVFEDVRFHRATSIPKQGEVELTLMLQPGSGRFEVVEGGTAVVTGFVRAVSDPGEERVSAESMFDDNEELILTSRDIYKELRLRGYQYMGVFRGLKGSTANGSRGSIEWNNNWVAFMDNMLQMQILGLDTRGLFVPTAIQKLVIDTKMHLNQVRSMPDENKAFPVYVDKDLDIIVSGGVKLTGLKASAIARKKPAGDPVLEEYNFVAHRDRAEMPLEVVTRIATHIALDSHLALRVQTVEVIDEKNGTPPEKLTSPMIQEILSDWPLLHADVNIIAPIDKFEQFQTLPPTITISDIKKLPGEFNALLVVGHGLIANKNTKVLKQARTLMKDGGFLLAREPLNADSGIFSTINSEGFDVVLEKRTKTELVLLLHNREKLPEVTAVIKISNNEFTWLPELQAALKAGSEEVCSVHNRIVVVSEGDYESGLMGLVNCLRREAGGGVIQGLLIQDLQAPKFSLDNPFFAEQLKLGLSHNVLRPGKTWGSYRFFKLDPLPLQPVYHAQVHQPIRGDLSSLTWVEGIIKPGSPHRSLINIHYSALNFRDVMLATGKLAAEVIAKTREQQENVIGLEFAGTDMNGQRVMGIMNSGAISNLCCCDRDLLWSVPDEWTLEEAVTVPAVYSTVYYALDIKGKMQRGDKVLIHAGSGGVGQAAITIALHRGCEVFTTVGTQQKREFIKKRFPQIDDDHIGNSRDTSFEQWILRQTQGKGVDIVLNSLAEEKLQASVRSTAKGGRFLEIGKFDLAANSPLGMEAFLKGISFHGVLIDRLFSATREKKLEVFEILKQGIRSGAVKPLVRTVFPMDQVEAAFRYMAAGKHIGKVILKIRDTEDAVVQPFFPLALPRYYCSEGCSYLILGGLGGFGLELADWLVLRGAKKIVLTSRRGISKGYQKLRIDLWKSYGVKIVVIAGKDASIHEDCEAILKQAAALGPVDAIFNLAVVLEDALCENQTMDTFEKSLRVKAWATKQLDKLSRILCPDLRQFVVFSSVSCGRGNAGQTNYGMANSIMERICESRAAENLPALAVQWGAIGDVGLVADMQEEFKEVVIGGTLQQKISSCLQELDGFLRCKRTVVSSMVVAEKRAGGSGATNIVDTVVNIMGLKDLKTVSLHSPLAELGMDSMMAVEIKQTLEREFELFLTAQDIRALSFAKLQEMSAQQDEQKACEKKASDQTEDLDGMKMLIRTVGTDKLDTNICVSLPTKAENGRGEVFILPGIEGTHVVFQPLAGKLRFPTTCLQLGTSTDLLSVDDMVDYLIPHVKARLKDRRDFVIAGYSFGSLLAIELVRRLESEGLRGRLVVIDGGPEYMKAVVAQHMSGQTDDQLQSNILLGIMDILAPSATAKLLEELKNCSNWNQRFLAFSTKLPKDRSLNFTPEDQEAICTSIYHRVRAIVNYDCSTLSSLRTPITLLRPKIQAVRLVSEDYGLRALTQGKVEVHYTEGNHVTMLDDDICASAINGDPLAGAVSLKKSIIADGANLAPIPVDSLTRS